MLFFRNCPPNDVIVVSDDAGYVYIFKLEENRLAFFDMIRLNCGEDPLLGLTLVDYSDIVTANNNYKLAKLT